MKKCMPALIIATLAGCTAPDVGTVTAFNGRTVTVQGGANLSAEPQTPGPNQTAAADQMCRREGKRAEYISTNYATQSQYHVDYLFACV